MGAFRFKYSVFSAIALLIGASDALARDIHFIANSISNITLEGDGERTVSNVDGTGVAQTGCDVNTASGLYSCSLPSLKCRVMIVNPSASSSVRVSVDMSYSTLIPGADPAPSLRFDPFHNNGGGEVTYTALADSGPAGWIGTITANGAMTANNSGANITLAAGEYYIFEKYVTHSYTFSGEVAPNYLVNMATYSRYPWGKYFNTCSGTVTVNDVTSAQPGFVLANGTLDYYMSSYQNPDIEMLSSLQLTANMKQPALRQQTVTARSAGYALIDWVNSTGQVGSHGHAECNARATCYSNVEVTTHKGKYSTIDGAGVVTIEPFVGGMTSRNSMLRIGKVPVVINGGMPF